MTSSRIGCHAEYINRNDRMIEWLYMLWEDVSTTCNSYSVHVSINVLFNTLNSKTGVDNIVTVYFNSIRFNAKITRKKHQLFHSHSVCYHKQVKLWYENVPFITGQFFSSLTLWWRTSCPHMRTYLISVLWGEQILSQIDFLLLKKTPWFEPIS